VEKVYDRCCGVDVHKKLIVACFKQGKEQEIREFGATTRELLEMTEWLAEGGCEQVAMESTASYWKPLYNILEAAGIGTMVVNAQHMKAVPGRKTDVVKSEKFSEIIQSAMNRYLNGMLTNEEVIEELLNLAKQIATAQKEGDQLGLTADELAFYDALTKPRAIKDFYENEELIAITKELADTLRKNRTIDWQKRDSARAKMRMMIKKLLKKHRYPPEGMDDAVQIVMTQCELWTDNTDMEH
jgi:type I restriction enzyme R subunit